MKPSRLSVDTYKKSLNYKMPKFLFNDPYKNSLSNDARILFMFLYDKLENEPSVDENGDIFIAISRIELLDLLQVKSRDKVIKIIKELVNAYLIEDVRQGLQLNNKIYLLKID